MCESGLKSSVHCQFFIKSSLFFFFLSCVGLYYIWFITVCILILMSPLSVGLGLISQYYGSVKLIMTVIPPGRSQRFWSGRSRTTNRYMHSTMTLSFVMFLYISSCCPCCIVSVGVVLYISWGSLKKAKHVAITTPWLSTVNVLWTLQSRVCSWKMFFYWFFNVGYGTKCMNFIYCNI